MDDVAALAQEGAPPDSIGSFHSTGSGMTQSGDQPEQVHEAPAVPLPAAALAAAFAALPVGMAVIADDGRIVVMNEALAAMCGVGERDARPTRAGELAALMDIRDADGAPLPEGQSPIEIAGDGGSLPEAPMIVRVVGSAQARPVACAVTPIDDGDGWGGALMTVRERLAVTDDRSALEDSQAALRVLVADRERVQAEERRRIARDLHDDLQQSLSALNMRLGMAEDALAHDPEEARQWLVESQRNVIDAAGATRRIIEDLRPQGLYHRALVGALRDLADAFTARTGVECDLAALPDAMPEPPEEVADCIYRIAQESLTNIAKHAGATSVHMRLERSTTGAMRFTVADDGRGLDVPTARFQEGSYGLLGMSERVRALNGEMRVTGSPGKGTTVEAEIPLAAAAGDPA